MISLKVDFIIRQNESLEFVQEIITGFIENIRRNEPDTWLYKSFQHSDDPRHFFHVMTFKDEEAQLKHTHTGYCKDFVAKLYPLCEKKPEASALNEVTVT